MRDAKFGEPGRGSIAQSAAKKLPGMTHVHSSTLYGDSQRQDPTEHILQWKRTGLTSRKLPV